MRRLILVWISGVLGLAAAADAEVVVTAGSAGTAVAGRETEINVYFLNTGPAAETIRPPLTIPAKVTVGTTNVILELRRQAAEGSQSVTPGAFLTARYTVAVPSGATGMMAIELNQPGSPRLAVAIATPAGEAPAGDNTSALRLGRDLLPNEPAVPRNDSGVAETILPRFSPHEPIYFVTGPERPNAKFQVSFKYQVLNPQGSWSEAFPPLSGLHLAYSQTSFWDLEGDSAPFLDSSYRPELLWSAKDWRIEESIVSRLGLQVGINHESNGRDGGDSRSLNVAYIRPSITLGDVDGLFVTFAPKIYTYIQGMDSANDDIADYRGHFDLRLIVGDRDGLQLAIVGRVGDDWDQGSAQFDLSYPMRKFFGGNVDLYLHAQYFTGFGESLLEYDEYTNRFRLGVSIVR